jgi:hypothetical protein
MRKGGTEETYLALQATVRLKEVEKKPTGEQLSIPAEP